MPLAAARSARGMRVVTVQCAPVRRSPKDRITRTLPSLSRDHNTPYARLGEFIAWDVRFGSKPDSRVCGDPLRALLTLGGAPFPTSRDRREHRADCSPSLRDPTLDPSRSVIRKTGLHPRKECSCSEWRPRLCCAWRGYFSITLRQSRIVVACGVTALGSYLGF
jgi:hypothetical protein